MSESQGLILGMDVDFMNANHRTKSQGMNADFVLGTLAFAGAAAVFVSIGTDFLDGLCRPL